MPIRYMKKIVMLIILLLLLVVAAAIFLYEPYPQQQEFRGTFVRSNHGHIHQAEKESGFGKQA